MAKRFITIPQVLDKVALSRTELYRRINAGTFPRSIALGPQKVVFLESDVEAWMQARQDGADEGAGWRRERAERAVGSRRDRRGAR
jgi:prophage regulatory protein